MGDLATTQLITHGEVNYASLKDAGLGLGRTTKDCIGVSPIRAVNRRIPLHVSRCQCVSLSVNEKMITFVTACVSVFTHHGNTPTCFFFFLLTFTFQITIENTISEFQSSVCMRMFPCLIVQMKTQFSLCFALKDFSSFLSLSSD